MKHEVGPCTIRHLKTVMVGQGVVKNREEAYGMDCCVKRNATICNTEGCGIKRLVEKGEGETFFEWGRKEQ